MFPVEPDSEDEPLSPIKTCTQHTLHTQPSIAHTHDDTLTITASCISTIHRDSGVDSESENEDAATSFVNGGDNLVAITENSKNSKMLPHPTTVQNSSTSPSITNTGDAPHTHQPLTTDNDTKNEDNDC